MKQSIIHFSTIKFGGRYNQKKWEDVFTNKIEVLLKKHQENRTINTLKEKTIDLKNLFKWYSNDVYPQPSPTG